MHDARRFLARQARFKAGDQTHPLLTRVGVPPSSLWNFGTASELAPRGDRHEELFLRIENRL